MNELSTELLLSTCGDRIFDAIPKIRRWSTVSRVLVVHQTSENELSRKAQDILSKLDNVTYIRQLGTGVTRSRNLALRHAIGDLLLFVDDDVELEEDFSNILKQAYQDYPSADAITFSVRDCNSVRLTKPFPKNFKHHNKLSILKVGTIEISMRRRSISNGVFFPEDLGAGAILPLCDEPVFLSNLIDTGASVYYVPKVIVRHPMESSGGIIDSFHKLKSRKVAFERIFGQTLGKFVFLAFSLKNCRRIFDISWVVDCFVNKK